MIDAGNGVIPVSAEKVDKSDDQGASMKLDDQQYTKNLSLGCFPARTTIDGSLPVFSVNVAESEKRVNFC